MKTPFRYQTTEYDCVPTTFINALQYLFHRDEIPPAVIQKIMQYSLDTVNSKGEWGKQGTTDTAVMHILELLKSYPDDKFRFKKCEYLKGEQIKFTKASRFLWTIREKGGVVVMHVRFGKNNLHHYILGIGIKSGHSGYVTDNWIECFDPYYRVKQFKKEELNDLEWLGTNGPDGANLRIRIERLASNKYDKYCLGKYDERECYLLERE